MGDEDTFTDQSIRLRRLRETYDDFSHKAHLPTQYDRAQVLGYGRSVSGKAVWASSGLFRRSGNPGVFSVLPERMSKKHVREVAKEAGISLKGITLVIDKNEELLGRGYYGRADYEEIGLLRMFPDTFNSKEELTRTLYHEIMHIKQYRKFGAEYVMNNRTYFEQITYAAENNFIKHLMEKGWKP